MAQADLRTHPCDFVRTDDGAGVLNWLFHDEQACPACRSHAASSGRRTIWLQYLIPASVLGPGELSLAQCIPASDVPTFLDLDASAYDHGSDGHSGGASAFRGGPAHDGRSDPCTGQFKQFEGGHGDAAQCSRATTSLDDCTNQFANTFPQRLFQSEHMQLFGHAGLQSLMSEWFAPLFDRIDTLELHPATRAALLLCVPWCPAARAVHIFTDGSGGTDKSAASRGFA